MRLLFELDINNNRFVGAFPKVVFSLPMLKSLDNSFNEFEGRLPSQCFNKDLDAIFVNNNMFHFDFGEIFSPVAKLTSIRVLMSLAATFDLEI